MQNQEQIIKPESTNLANDSPTPLSAKLKNNIICMFYKQPVSKMLQDNLKQLQFEGTFSFLSAFKKKPTFFQYITTQNKKHIFTSVINPYITEFKTVILKWALERETN